MRSKWRKISREIINQIIKDNMYIPEKELKKKIREAYPFGERNYHPYKIWLDEVKEGIKRRDKIKNLMAGRMTGRIF